MYDNTKYIYPIYMRLLTSNIEPVHNSEVNLEIQVLAADRWEKISLYQFNIMLCELNKHFGVKVKGIVMSSAGI